MWDTRGVFRNLPNNYDGPFCGHSYKLYPFLQETWTEDSYKKVIKMVRNSDECVTINSLPLSMNRNVLISYLKHQFLGHFYQLRQVDLLPVALNP